LLVVRLNGGLYAVSPIVLLSLGGVAHFVGMAIEERERSRLSRVLGAAPA